MHPTAKFLEAMYMVRLFYWGLSTWLMTIELSLLTLLLTRETFCIPLKKASTGPGTSLLPRLMSFVMGMLSVGKHEVWTVCCLNSVGRLPRGRWLTRCACCCPNSWIPTMIAMMFSICVLALLLIGSALLALLLRSYSLCFCPWTHPSICLL